jgi:hypothetical protein
MKRHHPAVHVEIQMRGQSNLPQMVGATGTAGSFPGRLHRRQKQRHQHSDDRDHGQ